MIIIKTDGYFTVCAAVGQKKYRANKRAYYTIIRLVSISDG